MRFEALGAGLLTSPKPPTEGFLMVVETFEVLVKHLFVIKRQRERFRNTLSSPAGSAVAEFAGRESCPATS